MNRLNSTVLSASWRLWPLLAWLLVSGCAQQPARQHDAQAHHERPHYSLDDLPSGSEAIGESVELPPPPKTEKYPGTGVFINEEAARRNPQPPKVEGKMTLNFEGQDLQEVVKVILGDIMQENYVIAPGVKGKVTFSTARPVSAGQLMPILEMLLAWNNATLIWHENRYTVLPIKNAIKGQLTPRMGPVAAVRGYQVQAVPLHYIAPSEMEKLLKPYARDGAVISADNTRGLLFLGGTRAELANYLKTIEIFDVDWLKGMSVGIFPLDVVEAGKMIPELEQLFGEGAGTPLAGMFRFLPLERLNAVVVITPQPDYLNQAETWIRRLDRGGSEAGTRLYVYSVKNVKAADLADTLSQIFTGKSASSSKGSSNQGGVTPGLKPARITSTSKVGKDKPKSKKTTPAKSGGRGLNVVQSDDIRITAVEENNALLIRATPSQYDTILSAIKRLDEVPLQVHIEAQVIEVSLEGQLQHGVRWFFENAIDDGTAKSIFDGGQQSGLAGAFGPAADAATAFYSWTGPDVQAVVSLLESTGKTRVVSTPSLTVINNAEANLNVGDQIPVNSTSFNPSGGVGSYSSVQYLNTGVKLSVTPRVNPGGLVFMEITQEVSSPKDNADVNGNRTVSTRTVTTQVAVQSGETLALGGLISTEEGLGASGVPGLHRIPLLGNLFGSKRRTKNRKELIVFITPTVVRSIEDARTLTEEYQKKFQGIKPIQFNRRDKQ